MTGYGLGRLPHKPDPRDYRLAAPFAGRIIRREAEPGDLARAGTAMFVLADMSALRITADTAPPGTGEVGRQIRTATRRFAWEKAALNGANEPGAASVVKDISEKAAWMWRPAEAVDLTASTAAPSPAECLIFRISPTELWPEIELWHSRNVGTGPLTGGVFNEDSRYRFFEGGGNSGGGGSGWWPGGPSGVRSIGNPFRDFTPHGSSTVPGSIPSSDDRSVIVIPPADTSSDESKKPPDTPPVVPEPSAGLLMLPAAWLLRRR